MADFPTSILFACDHNAVRSPMAEGIMKKNYGRRVYVQSCGVKHDLEINGFAIAVAAEIGVSLADHQARSFHEMEEWGDQIGSYELIVALSPAAQRVALEYTRFHSIDVEYWQIIDPTGIGRTRLEALDAFRQTRDMISDHIIARFGPPDEPEDEGA